MMTSQMVKQFARRQLLLCPSSQLLNGGPSSALSPSLLSSNNNITPSSTQQQQQSRQMTILSKESAETFKQQNYSQRMESHNRPVSPHVTIYSFPIVALSSITTRVTGCLLSFGSAGLGLVEIVGGNGAALDVLSSIGSSSNSGVLVAGAKFSVAFPFMYHYLGGLRHLVWDNKPEMLTNVGVEKASYVLVGSSLVLSGVAMFV